MDAQSFHQHETSTPKRRLGMKANKKPVVEIAGNDDIEPVINKSEPPRDEVPDVDIVEVIEPVPKNEAPQIRGAIDSVKPKEETEEDINIDKDVDEAVLAESHTDEDEAGVEESAQEPAEESTKPNPWTPEAVENGENEDTPAYKFSSTPVQAPVRHVRIEPAKPVRDNVNSIIMILLIMILVLTVATYTVILTREASGNREVASTPTPSDEDVLVDDKVEGHEDVFGVWEIVGGPGCFVFDEKDSFYWYQSCLGEQSDYHFGHLTAKRGKNALDSVGVSYERALAIASLDKQSLGENDIYALDLKTELTKSNGEMRTNSLSNFSLLFVHVSATNAQVYNMSTNDSYYLVKSANTAEEWRSNRGIEQPIEQPVEEPVDQPTDQPVEQPSN